MGHFSINSAVKYIVFFPSPLGRGAGVRGLGAPFMLPSSSIPLPEGEGRPAGGEIYFSAGLIA
jgi:hypothetical protein